MSLDSGAHYTFMMVNYWTFTIQMKFHEEGILKKMEGERRFAFIPVALPHFVSLPLPPSVSPPSSVSLFLPLSPVSSLPSSHITSVPPVVQAGIAYKVLPPTLLGRLLHSGRILESIVSPYRQRWRRRGAVDMQAGDRTAIWGWGRPFPSSLFLVFHVGYNLLWIPQQTPLLSYQRSAPCSPAAASTSIFHFGKFAVTRISTIRGKFFTWIAIFYMEKAVKGERTLSLSLLSSL